MATDYCCEEMRERVEYRCEEHPDPYECADNVVVRAADGSFGLPIHDGGWSHIFIAYCPWCGRRLPEPPVEELDVDEGPISS